MKSEKFKKYLQKRTFLESLYPFRIFKNRSNRPLVEDRKRELTRYAPYTEYSSFHTYVQEETPNLSQYEVHNIPNPLNIRTNKKGFIGLDTFELLWIASLIATSILSVFWLKARNIQKSESSFATHIHMSDIDCSFEKTETSVWTVRNAVQPCEIGFSSSHGNTRVLIFPNTSLSMRFAGNDGSDLSLEIDHGKIYLKEKLNKKSGSELKLGHWNIQLTGTKILLDSRNDAAYVTLLEGSLESVYSSPEKTIKQKHSSPGEVIRIEPKSSKIRKKILDSTRLRSLNLQLETGEYDSPGAIDPSAQFRFEKDFKDPWIVRLKNGKIFKGKIRTALGKIFIVTRNGEEVFDEKDVLSVSK